MGKNGRFNKTYGKVVGKDSQDRPGWKGPGYVKKAQPKPKTATPSQQEPELVAEPVIPAELQQLLLNIFKDCFPAVLLSDNLQPLLQEVKAALYDRDFQKAFGQPEYLEAYSVRWSPSRALCYQSILVDISEHLSDIFPFLDSESSKSPTTKSSRVVCFGGGSAEVVAFGGFLRYLQDGEPDIGTTRTEDIPAGEVLNLSVPNQGLDTVGKRELSLLLLDSARWQEVVLKLQQGLIAQPTLSKYASAAAKAANSPLLSSRDIASSYQLQDILEMGQDELASSIGENPLLLTCLFTLNELYTASIAKTTAFLLKLTTVTKPGTVFLVVDSPGSYSETTVGSEHKKYPMNWLLDHCLLTQAPKAKESTSPDWCKIVTNDSKWFRVPEVLRYPIPLESMRYQIHLYRRI